MVRKTLTAPLVGGTHHVYALTPNGSPAPIHPSVPTQASQSLAGGEGWSDLGGVERAGLRVLEQKSMGVLSLPPLGSSALCGALSIAGRGTLGLVHGEPSGHERGLEGSRAGPAPPLGGFLFTTDSPASTRVMDIVGTQ